VYTVTLTAVDSFGAAASVTKVVDINKMALGEFLYPVTVVAGQVASFDGSPSFDPDAKAGAANNGIKKFVWAFGDVIKESVQPTIQHTFPPRTTGPVIVRLTVIDDDGLTSTNIPEHTVLVQ